MYNGNTIIDNTNNSSMGYLDLFVNNGYWFLDSTITGVDRSSSRIVRKEKTEKSVIDNIKNGSWKINDNSGGELFALAFVSMIGYTIISIISMSVLENIINSEQLMYYTGLLFFFVLPITLFLVIVSRNNHFFHKLIRNSQNLPLHVDIVSNNKLLSEYGRKILDLEDKGIEMSAQWGTYETIVQLTREYQTFAQENPNYYESISTYHTKIIEFYKKLDNELNEISKVFEESQNSNNQIVQKIHNDKLALDEQNRQTSDEFFAKHIEQKYDS